MISIPYTELIPKVFIAFFVFVGLVFIFYPVFRFLRKPWHSLLLLTVLVSIVVFLIMGTPIQSKVNNAGEVVAYLFGIFLGVVLASLFFGLKSVQIETSAEKSSALQRKLKKDIRLRHLLHIGILVEERGKDFYEGLAQRAADSKVKELCRRLTREEIEHRQLIAKMLYRWLPVSIDRKTLDFFEKELEASGIFKDPPPADSTIEALLAYALDQERKMVDFYASFESAFPAEWKRMHVKRLADEEIKHVRDLMDYLSAISMRP